MSDVIRVAAAGVIAAVCAITLRKQTPELAILLTICACVLILLSCSGALASVMQFTDELTQLGGLSPGIIAPVIKASGIAILTRLSSDVCRDANEGALASVVESAGTVLALLVVLPLMSAVLELLNELLV